MDAFVMCGEDSASKKVLKSNKSFLPIHGVPSFIYVVRELLKVDLVERIFVVGDKDELSSRLSSYFTNAEKTVTAVEQTGSLIDSAISAFEFSLSDLVKEEKEKRVALYLSGDIPLTSKEEIEQFIENADIENNDYIIGISPDYALKRFAPGSDLPGIELAYFYFKEGMFRVNNLHMARPYKIKNLWFMQEVYKTRYQKNIFNILDIFKKAFSIKEVRKAIIPYIALQVGMFASRFKLTAWITQFSRRLVTHNIVTDTVSAILGCRSYSSLTYLGGSAIDIDKDRDYEIILKRFDEWKKIDS